MKVNVPKYDKEPYDSVYEYKHDNDFSASNLYLTYETIDIPDIIDVKIYKNFNGTYDEVLVSYRYESLLFKVGARAPIYFMQSMVDQMAGLILKQHNLPVEAKGFLSAQIGDMLETLLADMKKGISDQWLLDPPIWSAGQSVSSHNMSVGKATQSLPGMQETVVYPCCHGKSWDKDTLWKVVQHLNDRCSWSREKIADWLDEEADKGNINIDFQPWGILDDISDPVIDSETEKALIKACAKGFDKKILD